MDLVFERNDDPELVVQLHASGAFRPAEGELARRHALDPDAHWLARAPDGRVAGVVSAVTYPRDEEDDGALAWLYGMAVAPEFRRKGVGRALLRHQLAHLESRGVTTVGLDATTAGAPLYATEGFRAVGATPRLVRAEGTQPRLPPGERTVSVYPISSCEIMDLWKYDRSRFGANRVPFLASSMARFPERTFVAFDRASGDVVGFVESQERWIGPLVAESEEAAARLLLAAERGGAPGRAIAAPDHAGAARVLAQAGFVPEGVEMLRMVRGGALPGRAEPRFLVSGWALG